jgi:outer membrane protein OmpA-like peptidoglycan-associated protein
LTFWGLQNILFAQITLRGNVLDAETGELLKYNYVLTETESGKIIAEKKSSNGSYEVSLKPDLQYNLIFTADFYEELGITFRINKSVTRDFTLEILREGSISSLGDLPFEQGKAELLPETEEKLLQLAQWLQTHKKIKKLEVRGHTDKIGDPLLNMKLSQMRSQAVVDFLVKNGVEAERLTATGFGSTMPLEKTANPKNRRVEIKVVSVSSR